MNNKISYFSNFFFLILLSFYFLLAESALAEEIQISASTDNTEITLEDTLNFSVTIQGKGDSLPPTLPSLPNFQVKSQGSSSSIQIVNGKKASSVTFNYQLIPKSVGTFTIAPITMEIDGNPYLTAPITINVKKQVYQPGTQSDIFAEAYISNNQPFINEQIIFTVKLYYKVEIRNLSLDIKLDTFREEDYGEPKKYTRVINGLRYQVYEIQTVLFPLKSGSIEIPSATLGVDIVYRNKRKRGFGNLDSFFSDPFFTNVVKTDHKNLLTNPISLKVKPLPKKNRPKNFSNLVGQFNISANISRKELEVGETTTLTLTASGKGNAQAINIAIPDLGNDFKIYKDQPEFMQTVIDKKISGTKIYKFALVPMVSGDLTISPISLSYFDVSKAKYQTIQTKPIFLNVTPSSQSGSMKVVESSKNNLGKSRSSVNTLGQDILPIHTNLTLFSNQRFSTNEYIFFGLGIFLPPILFWGFVFYSKHQYQLKHDIAFSRNKLAFKQAKTQLDKISQSTNLKDMGKRLSLIVREYIGNKLNLIGTAFTSLEVTEQLQQRGYPQEQIIQTRELLDKLELLQYANGSNLKMQDLFEESKKVISSLEK